MDYGLGSEVWDVDGNRYLDFASGIAVCSTGHSHPEVVQAIQQQAERFIHISSDFYHPVWVEFSEKLASKKPFRDPARIFLGNSGTEAIEAAIKLARYHTGRQQFIGFYGSFHGRTMGSLAFTATKPVYRNRFFPFIPGVVHVPFPDPYRPRLSNDPAELTQATIRYIEEVVFENVLPPENCAGILLEPIQGEGGYVVPPDDFFQALRALCTRHGILLILDEVQSGVGRTGEWWAIENWETEPDIVCFAKGIASGVPLGGIMAKEKVMNWPTGAHGNTYGGNPIACSAGLATLKLIEGGYLQNAAEVGEYTLDALSEIQARHPSIGDVRGKGLMIGVEFVLDKQSKEPAHDLRENIVDLAFQEGLITLGSGVSSIRIAPALNISKEQIDEGLNALESAITAAERGL
jgi:4-aminobutyrate aminotransferase